MLLIPALGGYYFLSRSLVTRYWVARQTGYKLFFSAALVGVFLLATARLIAIWLGDWWASVGAWWHDYAPFEYAGTVFASAFLAVLAAELPNPLFNKTKRAMRTAKANGDLIECLMQEAVDSKGSQLVQISTQGGKCYIGFALESGVAAAGEPDIAITPIASGYRDSETRELRIVRNYLPALQSSDLGLAEFRVVIPLGEIASARRFDPDAYDLLHRTNPADHGTRSGESAP